MSSEFYELLEEGMGEMLAETRDATGAEIEIYYNGKSAAVVPGTQKLEAELKRTGQWVEGMVIVEMFRSEVVRLNLVDRSAVQYGSARAPMTLRVFDDDLSDPCQRLTLQPRRP